MKVKTLHGRIIEHGVYLKNQGDRALFNYLSVSRPHSQIAGFIERWLRAGPLLVEGRKTQDYYRTEALIYSTLAKNTWERDGRNYACVGLLCYYTERFRHSKGTHLYHKMLRWFSERVNLDIRAGNRALYFEVAKRQQVTSEQLFQIAHWLGLNSSEGELEARLKEACILMKVGSKWQFTCTRHRVYFETVMMGKTREIAARRLSRIKPTVLFKKVFGE